VFLILATFISNLISKTNHYLVENEMLIMLCCSIDHYFEYTFMLYLVSKTPLPRFGTLQQGSPNFTRKRFRKRDFRTTLGNIVKVNLLQSIVELHMLHFNFNWSRLNFGLNTFFTVFQLIFMQTWAQVTSVTLLNLQGHVYC